MMIKFYKQRLTEFQHLYRDLCNNAVETKRKLYDNPNRTERDILAGHLKSVRQLIIETVTVIKQTKKYIKEWQRNNPQNEKPKKYRDPRVEDCQFRNFDRRYHKSVCAQRIDGRFCLGTDCPYIANADEFETVSISTVQRVLESVLNTNQIDGEATQKIISTTLSELRNR